MGSPSSTTAAMRGNLGRQTDKGSSDDVRPLAESDQHDCPIRTVQNAFGQERREVPDPDVAAPEVEPGIGGIGDADQVGPQGCTVRSEEVGRAFGNPRSVAPIPADVSAKGSKAPRTP